MCPICTKPDSSDQNIICKCPSGWGVKGLVIVWSEEQGHGATPRVLILVECVNPLFAGVEEATDWVDSVFIKGHGVSRAHKSCCMNNVHLNKIPTEFDQVLPARQNLKVAGGASLREGNINTISQSSTVNTACEDT